MATVTPAQRRALQATVDRGANTLATTTDQKMAARMAAAGLVVWAPEVARPRVYQWHLTDAGRAAVGAPPLA